MNILYPIFQEHYDKNPYKTTIKWHKLLTQLILLQICLIENDSNFQSNFNLSKSPICKSGNHNNRKWYMLFYSSAKVIKLFNKRVVPFSAYSVRLFVKSIPLISFLKNVLLMLKSITNPATKSVQLLHNSLSRTQDSFVLWTLVVHQLYALSCWIWYAF